MRLSPSLGLPTKPNRCGRVPQTFDCGRHGHLSRRQIALMAGISYHAVCVRLSSGWKGAQLCQKPGDRPNAKRGEIRLPTILAAVKLARRFRDRLPSVEEIRRAKPMSQAAAIRWRQAIRVALEDE